MSNTNKLAFSNGMRDGIPIATGYFAVAFTLGIAAKNAGFTPIQAMIVSMTNNASAGEYAVTERQVQQVKRTKKWTFAMMTCAGVWLLYVVMSCMLYIPEGSAALAEEDVLVVEVAPKEEPNSIETLAEGLLVEVLRDDAKSPDAAGKRILIYHTHTYEAYEQDPAKSYQQIER